jgi:putative hydrolase
MPDPAQVLREDMHIHSTFSDGRHSIWENVVEAEKRGLCRIACVDHVRTTSTFCPDFLAEVRHVRSQAGIDIQAGVEAKILDGSGRLDVPEQLAGIDYIYAADHQFPIGDRCYKPIEVRHFLRDGKLQRTEAVDALINATLGVLRRYPRVVLAHLFSILPKVGIDEESVPLSRIHELAELAKQAGAAVEIDERWRCPGPRTLREFYRAGVPIFSSTDSHDRADIGVYSYVQGVWAELLASCAG